MFHSSTQRQHWVFRSEEEVDKLRRAANGAYFEKVLSTVKPGGRLFIMISSLRGVACESRGRQRLSDADVGRGEADVPVLHEEATGVLQRIRAASTQECSGK